MNINSILIAAVLLSWGAGILPVAWWLVLLACLILAVPGIMAWLALRGVNRHMDRF